MKTGTLARWKRLALAMNTVERHRLRPACGFTLVELLTVIALIAVLASLLLTAVGAARKKSRLVTCTSNLHQFTLALNLYLEDSGGQRPTLSDLVTSRNLASPSTLICPEDKTGDWGEWVLWHGFISIPPTNGPQPVNYSYLLHPLSWSEAEWKLLVHSGSRAGVAACQLHGLGNQATPNVLNYSGLLLRAQLDGSVLQRQFFWTPLTAPPPGSTMPTGVGDDPEAAFYPLQIYYDDPANWQGFQ
jgi:prepilin-type N-terminal cleavage/methylation domain-containing protein